jgi:hypothetical protein
VRRELDRACRSGIERPPLRPHICVGHVRIEPKAIRDPYVVNQAAKGLSDCDLNDVWLSPSLPEHPEA